MKYFYLLLCFALHSALFAQERFELLIPWNEEGDTSADGVFTTEDDNGDFFILSTIHGFSPVDGILIQGYPTYGISLVKLSPTGVEEWRRFYYLSIYNYLNIIQHFIINGNDIIIPYSQSQGYTPCENYPYTLGITHKKGILRINKQSGDITQHEQYPDAPGCWQNHREVQLKQTDTGYTLTYSEAFQDGVYHYLESLNSDFEVLSLDTLIFEEHIHFLNVDDKLLGLGGNNFNIYDLEGSLMQTYNIPLPPDSLTRRRVKFTENADYHAIAMEYRYPYPSSAYAASLHLVNKQNGQVSYRFLENKRMNDVVITSDNKILTLSNDHEIFARPQNGSDTVHVQITQFDLSLQAVKSQIYGMPYVLTSNLILSNDEQGFIVTGSRFKSMIDDINENEANQIYILKGLLEDLVASNDLIPENDYEVSIFPNPTDDLLNIAFPNQHVENVEYLLYDNNGAFIKQGRINDNISLRKLPVGVYYIKILFAQNEFITRKIIVNP